MFAATIILSLAFGARAGAEKRNGPGVTDTEIKIGQTMPYSGPASAYAAIGRAEAAYFRMINERGGIDGRAIVLISLDDGYSPPRTVEQTRKLVEQDQVLLLFSTFGTAPNVAIQRYLNDRGVPQLFPVSGATRWDDPRHFPWTMGFQPSLQIEGRAVARYILRNRPNARIAVLSQDDDFGKDYLKGLVEGLGRDAARMVAMQLTYTQSDPTVDTQILSLQASGAEILVDISTTKFAAQAIRKAYDIGWKPLHFVFSGASSRAEVLEPAGLEKAAGVVSAQWAKDPTDPRWRDDEATAEWAAWMHRYNSSADPTSSLAVGGYNWAMALVQVLRQCGDDLTRENVMRQAAALDIALPMLLPGIRLQTSPTQFFAIHDIELKEFNGAVWQSIDNPLDEH